MSSPVGLIEEIKDLIALLKREIAVIQEGDLDLLSEIMPEKAKLVDKLEARADELEALAAQENHQSKELRGLLVELRELMQRDAHIISRVARSVRDVLQEAFSGSDRKNLSGLYDSRGRTDASSQNYSERFDRSL